jgi:hypothetical protein
MLSAVVHDFNSLEAALITIAICVIALACLFGGFGIGPWRRPGA